MLLYFHQDDEASQDGAIPGRQPYFRSNPKTLVAGCTLYLDGFVAMLLAMTKKGTGALLVMTCAFCDYGGVPEQREREDAPVGKTRAADRS